MASQAPLGTGPLWNTPGVSLPGPFRSLVRELRKNGVTGSRAFAVAWSQARRWAATSKNAQTRARWGRVVAQLEAARAKARATPNKTAHARSGAVLALASSGDGSGKHDLVFFTKRSTPKVLPRGADLGDHPAGYGRVVRRRPATADEERRIARGDWLRVDQAGNTPSSSNYKTTRYRPQLVKAAQEAMMSHPCPTCGVDGAALALAVPPQFAKKTSGKSGPPATTNPAAATSTVQVPQGQEEQFKALVARILKRPGMTRAKAEKAAAAILRNRKAAA